MSANKIINKAIMLSKNPLPALYEIIWGESKINTVEVLFFSSIFAISSWSERVIYNWL